MIDMRGLETKENWFFQLYLKRYLMTHRQVTDCYPRPAGAPGFPGTDGSAKEQSSKPKPR